MLEPSREELKVQPEIKEATPKELAESWLNFRKGQTWKDIAFTEQSIEFNRSYKPPLPSASSEGPGSTDYSDYEVSALEAEQWEYEREEVIDDLEVRQDRLHDELDGIYAQAKKVAEGDTELIEEFAIKEKERRMEIEEKRMKKEGKKKE